MKNMISISFKNFRKFKEEITFDLNSINFLVGKNSSGKSTLTKGYRLYLNNIQNLQTNSNNIFSYRPLFQFGGDSFDNPHIGTFGRALSKDADDNNIYFTFSFSDLVIRTTVSRYSCHYKNGDNEPIDFMDKTSAPITKIDFRMISLDAQFTFDFENESFIAEFNKTGNVDYYDIWKKKIASIEEMLKRNDIPTGTKEMMASESNRLKKCVDLEWKENYKYSSKLKSIKENGTRFQGQLYMMLINELMYIDSTAIRTNSNRFYQIKMVELWGAYIKQIMDELTQRFRYFINKISIKNIEAHSVTRSLVYNISDKNDYMAQTILNYINENIKNEDPEKEFINKWMQYFEIGRDFVIDNYGGESYKMEIIEDTDNPEHTTPLLDKGVGSNQLMILLLQLATTLHKNRSNFVPSTLIIEEPEQNLHPALQSKLADLFFEVYQYPLKLNKKSLGITFLIETHSEYIVRRTQVLVAKLFKKGEEYNPFKVFYVTGDKKTPSFEMGFQNNGKFEKSFGEGFYDVADDAAMELFDLDNEEN